MRGWSGKVLLAMVFILLGMFIGMDVTDRGIEQIAGPVPAQPAMEPYRLPEAPPPGWVPPSAVPASPPSPDSYVDHSSNPALYDPWLPLQPQPSDSLLAESADKTGKVLQKTSQKSVEWVVSIFERLMD
ncbi:hypothetical protein [Marinicrinis sediminis]|uniref:Uncharacterized protein n=1 Tax=Marinicrinis sediminis TaxID=1652465 RepID=A0ABW5R987_9BACL